MGIIEPDERESAELVGFQAEIITRSAPRWAWDLIDETLWNDAKNEAFDAALRESIGKAASAMVLASEEADGEPIREDDPRLFDDELPPLEVIALEDHPIFASAPD